MNIEGLLVTSEKIISTIGGDVFHAMKNSDVGYAGFGEAYFSTIEPNAIKAWKRHHEMTLNLLVPIGKIKFVLYDDRAHSPTKGGFQLVTLSTESYQRLTVPPMVWIGFQGRGKERSTLLNIANIKHDPSEIDRKSVLDIPFYWNQSH